MSYYTSFKRFCYHVEFAIVDLINRWILFYLSSAARLTVEFLVDSQRVTMNSKHEIKPFRYCVQSNDVLFRITEQSLYAESQLLLNAIFVNLLNLLVVFYALDRVEHYLDILVYDNHRLLLSVHLMTKLLRRRCL